MCFKYYLYTNTYLENNLKKIKIYELVLLNKAGNFLHGISVYNYYYNIGRNNTFLTEFSKKNPFLSGSELSN